MTADELIMTLMVQSLQEQLNTVLRDPTNPLAGALACILEAPPENRWEATILVSDLSWAMMARVGRSFVQLVCDAYFGGNGRGDA